MTEGCLNAEKRDGHSHSENRDFDQRWSDLWRDGENPSSEERIPQAQPIQVKREAPETDSCCSACGKMPVSAGSLCSACTGFSHQGAQSDSQTSSLLPPGSISATRERNNGRAGASRWTVMPFEPKFNLREVLLAHAEGESIVRCLDEDHCINQQKKNQMVRILVWHLMERFGETPTSQVKKALASSLVAEFPCLKDTEGDGYEAWYSQGKHHHPATGYLEERLRNIRKRIRRQTREQSCSSQAEDGRLSKGMVIPETTVSLQKALQMKEWLKHNTEPLSQVQEYMRETAIHRAHWIRQNGAKSIGEIVQEYPHVLSTPGMISQDFAIIYDGYADRLFERWVPLFAEKILLFATKEKRIEEFVQDSSAGMESLHTAMEDVQAAIKKILPELETEQLRPLVEHLMGNVGVENSGDLHYVQLEDIQAYLTPIQCQTFLLPNKQRDSNRKQVPQNCSSPLPSVSYSGNECEPVSLPICPAALPTTSSFQINMSSSWVSNFQVPWERMPPSLREAMAKRRRPQAADRRLMVRVTVDAMLMCCPNPNRAACAEVAKAIVAQHPHTFGDLTEEGEKLGSGYHSLLTQLKTRVEHVNRNNVVNRIRRPKRSNVGQDVESSSRQAKCLRTKVDSYGCINWQPKEFPEGETADSLENKRLALVAVFNSLGPSGAAVGEVDECMRLTYISQRQMINGCPPPTIGEVQEQWPFLFTKRWLCAHFQTLTGIDIDSRLSEALLSKGRRIVNFFQSQKTKWSWDVQCLLDEMQGDFRGTDKNLTAIAAILLVMKHFKEKEDSLFLSADVTATKTDIEEQLALPVTPRLIMLGNSLLTATRWMVSIEGKVAYVLDSQSDFAAALTVLFSSFYVFNIEYQEAACATLELVQRFFSRINPEYGIKCTAKVGVSRKSGTIVQRKAAAVNPHVTTFLQHLTEFQWKTSK